MYELEYIKNGKAETFQTHIYREYYTTYWSLVQDPNVSWMQTPKRIPNGRRT
jgi:hypothetical protein